MADIIQWNMRGYVGNFEDLKAVIGQNGGPACVCLQKTFHGDLTPFAPSRYTAIPAPAIVPHTPGTRPSRGVITLVKSNTPYYTLNLTTDLEAVAIRVNIGKEYTVCNIYISPNERITATKIVQLINQLPSPFIIVGDFNARSDLWGDSLTNSHGRVIQDVLSTTDICLLNDGSPTHFHIQTNTESCIDLTIVSPEALTDLTWTVCDDCHNSDHFPIIIKRFQQAPNNSPSNAFNYDKADWSLFKRLSIAPNNLFDHSLDIDTLNENFNSLIMNAATQAIPRKSFTGRYPIPWWNAECSRTQTERKAAKRRYKRTGNTQDKIALNRASAIARRQQRKSRKECWQNYISSINSDTPINKIFKNAQKVAGKYNGHRAIALEDNGSMVTDHVEVANLLGSHFSNISSNSNYDENFNRLRLIAENTPINFISNNQEEHNTRITMTELECSLKKCSDTAPGEDEITYQMLKNLSESGKALLLFLYNRIFLEDLFPKIWQKSILLPFPKPGKDPKLCNSYRPISLTSTVCKLLEKILNYRLIHLLENGNFFSKHQFGFRKARCTLEPLSKLQTEIYDAFRDKKHLVAIFFDIKKAYDSTWRHHILQTIFDAGVRGHLGNFISNFLKNRTFTVRVCNNTSESFDIEQGVPQGSVMSVTLFGAAINGIVGEISEDIGRSLFVDDLSIFCSGSSIKSIERRLQLAINKISYFTKRTGFQISTEKTVAVHFHRKRGLQQEPKLELYDLPITIQQEAKFLGMTFDQRLYWKAHIDNLKKRCLKSLNLIKMLSHQTWGADRCSLLKLYRSTTRAQLDYGCQIYSSAPHRFLQRLDAIHHSGIRMSLGAFRSSPILSLMAEAGEMKLEERRKQLCLQLYTRQLRITNFTSSDHFNNNYQQLLHSKPFAALAYDIASEMQLTMPSIMKAKFPSLPPWFLPDNVSCTFNLPKSKKSYPDYIVKRLFEEHLSQKHQAEYHIYTDGSKDNQKTGFGLYTEDSELSMRISDHCSIYTAELLAILTALEITNTSQHQNISIFTDSRSSIQGITNIYNSHPIVSKIQSKIIKLARSNIHVKICWIPSHVNLRGNECADTLAKNATNSEETHEIRVPHTDFKAVIKSKIKQDWSRKWHNIHPAENKLREIKNDTSDWNTNFPKNRRLEIIICRLRIGHTKLTHGHLMDRNVTINDCPHCGDETTLTIKHIMTECPQYNALRLNCFGRSNPSIRDILGKNLSINNVIRFLNNADITSKI